MTDLEAAAALLRENGYAVERVAGLIDLAVARPVNQSAWERSVEVEVIAMHEHFHQRAAAGFSCMATVFAALSEAAGSAQVMTDSSKTNDIRKMLVGFIEAQFETVA